MKTFSFRFLLLVVLLPVLVRATAPVDAQGGGPPAFAPASIRFDDLVYTVTVQGDWAYVGMDGGMAILEVKHPTAPKTVGYVQAPALGIAVNGDYAYAIATDEFRVVDIRNPYLPAKVAEQNFETVGSQYDVAVYGDYVYVGHSGGLAAIDVSDPYSLTLVGNLRGALGTVLSVDVLKDPSGATNHLFAYLGTARDVGPGGGWIGGGFRVIDVTEPTNPQEVYPCSNSQPCSIVLSAVDVAVEGRYAYMVNDDPTGEMNGLYTLDIIDATNIRTLAYLHTPGPAWHVAAARGRSHVAGDEGGGSLLYLFDVANKATPRGLGHRALESPAQQARLAAANGCVYVAEGARGLTIVCDTTVTPTPPPLVWLPLIAARAS